MQQRIHFSPIPALVLWFICITFREQLPLPAEYTNMQIFLVDDDLDDQEIFLMSLENVMPGTACLTGRNGVEALNKLDENKDFTPDFIFLDVNMPKMNGLECLSALKNIQRLKQTKIYMYSTSSETAVLEKSKSLGAIDLIVKPTDPAILEQILAGILKKSSE